MNKLHPIIVIVFLFSCGGGGDATTPKLITANICSVNDSSLAVIDTNSIKISVEKVTHAIDTSLREVPAENVVVQIDNNGPCIRTNNDGFVTFTALTNEPHDIHIFSPAGHPWISEYNVKTGEIKKYNIGSDASASRPQISYTTLTGTLSNKNTGTLINILVFTPDSKQQKYTAELSTDTNTYSVDLSFNVTPGVTLAADLIILEYQNNPATGDLFIIDTKVVKNFNITTAATVKTTITNLDIDFTVPKPLQRTTLLSFNSITLPVDLGLTTINVTSFTQPDRVNSSTPFFSLFYQYFNQDIPALDLSAPITFKAYDQFKVGKYQLELNAKPQNGDSKLLWRYYRVYSSNPTSSEVFPRIVTFPIMESNRSGDVISWDNVDVNLTNQFMRLQSKQGKVTWLITLDPAATSVRFPNIPKGISSRLFDDQTIELTGQLRSPETSELEEYWIDYTHINRSK